MKHIEFLIPITPVAASRPRVTRTHTYIPAKQKNYQKAIAKFYAQSIKEAFDIPVSVKMCFIMPRPQNHFRTGKYKDLLKDPNSTIWHSKKPDIDNLVKLYIDGLTDGGAWHDDGIVSRITAEKMWCRHRGEEGGISTEIREIAE